MKPTELDKAYAAGFFDGEGCIMSHNKTRVKNPFLRVTVGQNSGYSANSEERVNGHTR